MSRASRRRDSNRDEGGGANWMDTYGDMVTLLLTFFVLLFSFSSIDAAKWTALVGAFTGSTAIAIPIMNPEMAMQRPIEMIERSTGVSGDPDAAGSFEDPSNPSSPQDTSADGLDKIERDAFLELVNNLQVYISTHDISADMDVDYDAYIVTLRFEENIFYESGSADILEDSIPVLEHMAMFFNENMPLIEMIKIEGHTDSVPINTQRYPTNWELSAGRATTALRYLVEAAEYAVDPLKISAAGFGEMHPIRPNDSEEGRQKNRRVDFVLQAYKSR